MTVATPWRLDVLLTGVSALSALGLGGAVRYRARTRELPLHVAPVCARLPAARGHRLRFQVRLGNGRAFRCGRARVCWVPVQGDAVALPLVAGRLSSAVGPWTVLAVDEDALSTGPGRVRLEVSVWEGARRWRAQREWSTDELGAGRFRPVVLPVGGRLQWDPASWGRVE